MKEWKSCFGHIRRMRETANTLNKLDIISPIIFLVIPLLGVITSFYFLLKKESKRNLYEFAFLMALYVAFINVTKTYDLDLDLEWYSTQYIDAGSMSYIEYIFSFGINGKGKELFFPTFNYIIYQIIGDNVYLYRIIHSFICYIIAFFAIIKFSILLNIKYIQITIPIIFFTCFPWIFTYSETVFRQFLASSFLLYIIIEHLFYKKKMILLSICMFLTHTSTLIFIPLIYIPLFQKKLSKKNAIYCILCIVIFAFIQPISNLLLNILGNTIPALSYVLERASKDTTFELPPLSISKILFLISEIYILIKIYYKDKHNKIFNDVNTNIDGHFAFANIVIILNCFILGHIHQLELSNRFFMYSVFIASLIICPLLKKYKLSKPIIVLFFLTFNLILIYYYNTSMYTYDIPYGILFLPLMYI